MPACSDRGRETLIPPASSRQPHQDAGKTTQGLSTLGSNERWTDRSRTLMRIRDHVYDVTEFLRTHPGGSIIRYFSHQDATEAFDAFHEKSPMANAILKVLPSIPLEPYLALVNHKYPPTAHIVHSSNNNMNIPIPSPSSDKLQKTAIVVSSTPPSGYQGSLPTPSPPVTSVATQPPTDGDFDTHDDFVSSGKSERTQHLLREYREFREQLVKEGHFKPSLCHTAYRVMEVVLFFVAHFYLLSVSVYDPSSSSSGGMNGWAVMHGMEEAHIGGEGRGGAGQTVLTGDQWYGVGEPSMRGNADGVCPYLSLSDRRSPLLFPSLRSFTPSSPLALQPHLRLLDPSLSSLIFPTASSSLPYTTSSGSTKGEGSQTSNEGGGRVFSYMCLIAAIFVGGIAGGRCGWLQHEGGHNSLTGRPAVDKIIQKLGISFGLICYNGKWNNMHNKHHAVPQKEDLDPDVDTLPFLASYEQILFRGRRRYLLSYMQWWLKYQHYSFLLLTAVINVFFWHFVLHPREYLLRKFDITTASLVLSRYVVHLLVTVPLFGWTGGFFTLIATMFVSGIYLFGNFSLNHTYMPTVETEVHKNWLDQQLNHTANIKPHFLVNWWMGFLNCQIEHHLFPTMPQFRQPAITHR
eukprot:GHVQ01023355.1.p1 GENE.GHVQ01023355.1~~GHVQ01023355.1.p1  ORF type:complete len:632 (+),score=96.47 GHVQ01023355.1:1282-3177(+)